MTEGAPKSSVHRHAVAVITLAMLMLAMLAAPSAWAIVLERAIVDGSLAIAWAIAMAGIGSMLLPARFLHDQSRALVWATWTAAGIGIVSALVLVLGVMGRMSGAVAWGIFIVGWLSVSARVASGARASSLLRSKFELTPWIWFWICAAPALAVLIVAPTVMPGVLWGDEPHGYDVVEYHLQIPREWFEAGRIAPLPHNIFSFFPQGMEMHYLLAMYLRGGPWAGMYLAQFQHAVIVLTGALAIYGAHREGSRATAIAGAVIFLSIPWMPMVGTVAYNEGLLVLFATLCIVWTMRGLETGRVISICIAGAMSGFACGVKLTAMGLVVVPIILAAGFIAGLRARWLIVAGVMLGMTIVTSSPWWIRNVVWTKNPVFPEAGAVFGIGSLSSAQVERWRAAHQTIGERSGALARLSVAAEHGPLDWRFGYTLLPATLIAFALNWRDRRQRFLAAIALIQICSWVSFTHVQGRFILTAMPCLVLMVALAIDRAAWLALVAAMGGAACSCVLIASLARNAAYGVDDPNIVWSIEHTGQNALHQAFPDHQKTIALAGDAKAFWWPIPMNRLHYRTVFDVDVRPGESIVDAWIRGAPTDAIVVVDPNELRRFVKTYRGLGELPPEIADRDEPFVLR